MSAEARDNKRYLNTAAAARRLGVCAVTLRQWRMRGDGPRYLRLSDSPRGRCVYDVRDLDQWCEDRKVESTSQEVA